MAALLVSCVAENRVGAGDMPLRLAFYTLHDRALLTMPASPLTSPALCLARLKPICYFQNRRDVSHVLLPRPRNTLFLPLIL